MRRGVHVAEVERHHVRAAFFRQPQPLEHGRDASPVRDAAVVRLPERRPDAVDRRLGSGKEEARRHHALALGGDPDRLAAIPAAVADVLRVPEVVGILALRVVEVVADDAVVLGMKSGDQRVVVRERQRGKDRNHPRGARAPSQHPLEVRQREPVEIVGAEPVERDQDDVRLADLLRPVDAGRACRRGLRRRRWKRRPGHRLTDDEREGQGEPAQRPSRMHGQR